MNSLKQQLADIDMELARHRGNSSPEQSRLLRRRRELLVQLRDSERANWGD